MTSHVDICGDAKDIKNVLMLAFIEIVYVQNRVCHSLSHMVIMIQIWSFKIWNTAIEM